MPNNHFKLYRVGLLIRGDLANTYKRSLLIVAGLLAFNLISFLTLAEDSSYTITNPEILPTTMIESVKFHFYFFPISLLLGGFIFTSLSFWELKRKDTRQFFLSLPASNLEKGMSKWIVTGLIFPLIWLLAYQLFAVFANTWMINKGFAMVSLPLSDPWVWLWVMAYISLQSIFFLGAIVFPRISLVKTVLILLALGFIIRLIFLFTLENLFPLFSTRSEGMAVSEGWELSRNVFFHVDYVSFWLDKMPAFLLSVLIFGLLPILSYISYLKLKEKEL